MVDAGYCMMIEMVLNDLYIACRMVCFLHARIACIQTAPHELAASSELKQLLVSCSVTFLLLFFKSM